MQTLRTFSEIEEPMTHNGVLSADALAELILYGMSPRDSESDAYLVTPGNISVFGKSDFKFSDAYAFLWNACYHDGNVTPDVNVLKAAMAPLMNYATACAIVGGITDKPVHIDDGLYDSCVSVLYDTDISFPDVYDALMGIPQSYDANELLSSDTFMGNATLQEYLAYTVCNNADTIVGDMLDDRHVNTQGIIEVSGDGGFVVYDGAFALVRKFISRNFMNYLQLIGSGVSFHLGRMKAGTAMAPMSYGEALAFAKTHKCVLVDYECAPYDGSDMVEYTRAHGTPVAHECKYMLVAARNKTKIAKQTLKMFCNESRLNIVASQSSFK